MDEFGTEPSFKIYVQRAGEEIAEEVAYAVDFEEAREASDLHGVMQDLDFVTQICDHLEDRLLAQDSDAQHSEARPIASLEDHVNRSFWIAALTVYARCFSGGIRYKLPEELFKRTPGVDYTKSHRYYMDIRDKHVAHSVNSLEALDACVSLGRREDGSLEVESMGIIHATLGTLHYSEVQRLGSMADYARQFANGLFREASTRALAKAKGMSQEELRRLEPYGFAPKDGPEDVKRRRPGGKKGR